ncbi:MAG: hypothetical protein Q4F41_10830 [Eubacteriales bacterium]|nr:hypothetical protein [Eubacteriales bacterium]
MWRRDRKERRIAAVLGVCLWAAAGVPGLAAENAAVGGIQLAEDTSEKPCICGEDEYVLLLNKNNYAEIYDSQGNAVGTCRAILDSYYWAATIPKDSLLCYNDGETWSVFSMQTLQTILEVPAETHSCAISGDACLVEDPKSGTISLYNVSGTLLYQFGEGDWLSKEDGYTRILNLENGYLIGLCRYDSTELPPFGPVWVSKDGQEHREITDSYLKQAFCEGRVSAFGDYLMIYEWNTSMSAIYDLEGTLRLGQVDSSIYPRTTDNFSYIWNAEPALVLSQMPEGTFLYDTKLQECGQLSNPEILYPAYCAGFLEGMTYDELGGRTCDGFVTYNGSAFPYTRTEDGCLIYAAEGLFHVPLNEGEEPAELNASYLILSSRDEEENYKSLLVWRKSGEVLAESRWENGESLSFALCGGGCMILEENSEEGSSILTVRDSGNEVCYTSENVRAQSWKNGYMLLERGIYRGIADLDGNWIVRTIAGWSE